MKFARTVTDLHPKLLSNKYGPPRLPAVIPSALETFLKMRDDHPEQWPQANLASVYNYLRRSKYLNIPREWVQYVPRSI